MEEVLNQFGQLAEKNKLGHAYILYNVNFKDISNQLENIIYKYFFKYIDNTKFNSDIYLINPENNVISKEQIKELQNNVKSFSQFNERKVYIINSCEKMNLSAANSLLKFLEEPESNIYAFLITSDIDKVLNTIISRCYKIFVKNKEININSDQQEKVINLYYNLCNKSEKISDIYADLKNMSRIEIKEIIDSLILILKDFININNELKPEYCPYDKLVNLKIFSNEYLINKIVMLNDLSEKINYNINIQMFIDKLVTNW